MEALWPDQRTSSALCKSSFPVTYDFLVFLLSFFWWNRHICCCMQLYTTNFFFFFFWASTETYHIQIANGSISHRGGHPIHTPNSILFIRFWKKINLFHPLGVLFFILFILTFLFFPCLATRLWLEVGGVAEQRQYLDVYIYIYIYTKLRCYGNEWLKNTMMTMMDYNGEYLRGKGGVGKDVKRQKKSFSGVFLLS